MQQLVLLSVLLATFVVPSRLLRRHGEPRFGATLKVFVAFIAVYVVLLLFVYPRLF